jgi:hypothetical protein
MPLFNQTYFDSYFAAADCSDQNWLYAFL